MTDEATVTLGNGASDWDPRSAGVVLLAVAGAAALTTLLWPADDHARFSFYYLAVLVSVSFGNRAAGVLSIALSMASVVFLFGEQRFDELAPDRVTATAVFAGVAGCFVLLMQRMRAANAGIRATMLLDSARDLGQQNAQRSEIERLSLLYAALCHVNQAIVRLQTREELFSQVCAVLIEHGRFRMAWIGWHDSENQALVPVAQSGGGSDYLPYVRVDSQDPPGSRGPPGTAFVEGRPAICNDLLSEPSSASMREQNERLGYRASAAFPIRIKGQVCGTLTVYADERGYFREKEIALLTEAAFDLSFALDNLGHVAERERDHALAEKERLFATNLVETMPGIFYIYDEEGKTLRSNRNFETVSGSSESEIEQDRARDADQKSDERYRTRLDAILESCQLIGFDWRYLYLNHAAAVQNRRPNEELLGKTVGDAWPGIKGSSFYALLDRCMQQRVAVQQENRFDFVDGTVGWFDVRAQPVREGVFVLSIDISERKQAELSLRELNEGLELKVAERTSDLKAARERAESADRLKSTFLATMSHELRTPMNSIIGFTGMILQELAGPLNAEQSKQLRMVQSSARHLLELINDVLDLSKIEADQLHVRFEALDLRAAVETVTASVRPHAEKKGLQLTVELPSEPLGMTSDRRRVDQILLNLLNNAIKFTDRGDVTLRVECVVLEGRDAVRITVADTGFGIEADDLPSLFHPFRQIDCGLERQHEGTGLGLVISRRLADLLGGSIVVESKRGEGSLFTLTLPITPRTLAA